MVTFVEELLEGSAEVLTPRAFIIMTDALTVYLQMLNCLMWQSIK